MYTDTRIIVPLADQIQAEFVITVFGYLHNESFNPEIPTWSILHFASGEHVGPDASADLIVAGDPWTDGEWDDFLLRNIFDVVHDASNGGAAASVARRGILTNTYESGTDTTRVTTKGGLTGGVRNNFNTGDVYEITSNPTIGVTEIHYQNISNLGGAVYVDKKGCPEITGASGFHSFDWFLQNPGDPANDSVMATATYEIL